MKATEAFEGTVRTAPLQQSANATASVHLRDVRKHFRRRDGTRVPAIDGIDLEVKSGEFVVLLGPSGCGKTTLLRCIAGLESPDEGMITIHGKRHFASAERIDSSPDKRKLGMVFQSYALWPHMRVFSNVAYPLRVRKVPAQLVRARVANVLRTVGIEELAEQYPGQLSGGQQQRVALARALVSSEGLVLFDEPLSNVDAKVREQLRYEIRRMQKQIGFAAIYVTHDQEEAMELADRIAVLHRGKIAQLGPPEAIYNTPADRYVAKFIGATNEIVGRIVSVDAVSVATVMTEAGIVQGVQAEAGLVVGEEASVIVRPETCQLVPVGEAGTHNAWPIEQASVVFVGPSRRVAARSPGWGHVQVQFSSGVPMPDLGVELRLCVPAHICRVYRR
jgi:iron(III) transport system ATP-binding protein